MNKKFLIVVLGMHRSGTSAITRGLSALNVNLGGNLSPGTVGDNDKGFFEDQDITALNELILSKIGFSWDSTNYIPNEIIESLPQISSLRNQASDLLALKMSGEKLFGIKDPRLSLLLPFWKPVFNNLRINPSYVIALRDPISVAKSLQKRDGFIFHKSVLVWLNYMLSSLINSDNSTLVVGYDHMLNNPHDQLKRIVDCFKIPSMAYNKSEADDYQNNFLDLKLRHSLMDDSPSTFGGALFDNAYDAYESLLKLSEKSSLVTKVDRDQFIKYFHFISDSNSLRHVSGGEFDSKKMLTREVYSLSTWAQSLQGSIAERDAVIGQRDSELARRDEQLVRLNEQIQEVSTWAQSLQGSIAERDAVIDQRDSELARRDEQLVRLNEQIQEVSTWAQSLQGSIAERDAVIDQRDSELARRDEQLVRLNEQIQEVSTWAQSLQGSIAERDAVIGQRDSELARRDEQLVRLNEQIQEVSTWAQSLQGSIAEREEKLCKANGRLNELIVCLANERDKALRFELECSSKHEELMRISDWAFGMMQELERRNATFGSKLKSLVKRVVLPCKKTTAYSYIGNIYRKILDIKNFQKTRTSRALLLQSLKDNHGRLIIVFPIITWDFRWQRPQHIVSRLRNHGYSVLYLAMSLSPLGRVFRSKKEAIAKARYSELDRHINQVWLSTSKQLNIYTDQLCGEDLLNVEMTLNALISEMKPTSIRYLVQFPGWWPIVKLLREKLGGSVVFDCMDDHSGFSTNTKESLEVEDDLIADSNLVVVSSDVLEKRIKLKNENYIHIKNGTEFEHFANPKRNGELDYLCDHPIIGYYGAISDWFDMEIVAACARKHPEWNFVLIGSTFGAELQSIKGMKNVHLLGEKAYKSLPGYLAYFDVCLIPFKVIPLTLATNPVKFYEYLSAGKPVVSVELPELTPYREDCYLAKNTDEFILLLELAYKERDIGQKISSRIKLASENSWDSRVNTLLGSTLF